MIELIITALFAGALVMFVCVFSQRYALKFNAYCKTHPYERSCPEDYGF